jgi:hypothetical protein
MLDQRIMCRTYESRGTHLRDCVAGSNHVPWYQDVVGQVGAKEAYYDSWDRCVNRGRQFLGCILHLARYNVCLQVFVSARDLKAFHNSHIVPSGICPESGVDRHCDFSNLAPLRSTVPVDE